MLGAVPFEWGSEDLATLVEYMKVEQDRFRKR
jgi:hypothetical protein